MRKLRDEVILGKMATVHFSSLSVPPCDFVDVLSRSWEGVNFFLSFSHFRIESGVAVCSVFMGDTSPLHVR